MSSVQEVDRRSRGTAGRPDLHLVPPRQSWSEASGRTEGDEAIPMTFTFRELTLIHKSLQAVRTLGVFAPQDELLDDTVHLVDLVLNEAVAAASGNARRLPGSTGRP